MTLVSVLVAAYKPTYLESATVIFRMPKFWAAPYTYSWLAPSVITSGEAMTQVLTSPQSQRRVREAGGTARYDLIYATFEHQIITNNAGKLIPALKPGGLIIIEGFQEDMSKHCGTHFCTGFQRD